MFTNLIESLWRVSQPTLRYEFTQISHEQLYENNTNFPYSSKIGENTKRKQLHLSVSWNTFGEFHPLDSVNNVFIHGHFVSGEKWGCPS